MQKKEVVRRMAQRMNADEKTATAWLDACTETVYDALKQGESVTLPHFGGFYVRPRDHGTWTFRFNPSQRQCHQLKRLSKAVLANEVKQSPEISTVLDVGDRHASLAMTCFSLS